MSQLKMKSCYTPAAPGVVEHSTHMHAGQNSINQGATAGSRTANGTDVTGDFKAFTHSMPDVHFNKPQHDSEFVGTTSHPWGMGVAGSRTAHGAEEGARPA